MKIPCANPSQREMFPPMIDPTSTVAGIELGGTKTVVAWGTSDGTVREEHRFPTSYPEETFDAALTWLRGRCEPTALGIAAFGPVRVNPNAADYGTMLATPKAGWQGYQILTKLRAGLGNIPMAIDTDVNAALWAELALGAARGVRDAAYITIGTGIGAGILVDGRLVHGALHPEFGHLKVPRAPEDRFAGVCPFHHDCLEGMASGPAIHERWSATAANLTADDPAWDMEAWYLAHGILSLLAIVSPQKVIVGGGVSQADGLHAKIAERLTAITAGYFGPGDFMDLVVPPALGQDAGIRGALLLAGEVLRG